MRQLFCTTLPRASSWKACDLKRFWIRPCAPLKSINGKWWVELGISKGHYRQSAYSERACCIFNCCKSGAQTAKLIRPLFVLVCTSWSKRFRLYICSWRPLGNLFWYTPKRQLASTRFPCRLLQQFSPFYQLQLQFHTRGARCKSVAARNLGSWRAIYMVWNASSLALCFSRCFFLAGGEIKRASIRAHPLRCEL